MEHTILSTFTKFLSKNVNSNKFLIFFKGILDQEGVNHLSKQSNKIKVDDMNYEMQLITKLGYYLNMMKREKRITCKIKMS